MSLTKSDIKELRNAANGKSFDTVDVLRSVAHAVLDTLPNGWQDEEPVVTEGAEVAPPPEGEPGSLAGTGEQPVVIESPDEPQVTVKGKGK